MNDPRVVLPAPGNSAPAWRCARGWSPGRWGMLIALVFIVHVGLIFVFGSKKPIVPRAVTNVPRLALADRSSELIALEDPTLFALPHAADLAAAGLRQTPEVKRPSFRWTGPSGELASPAAKGLGAAFRQFMETNPFAGVVLNFKPAPKLSEPKFTIRPALPQNSTMQVTGDLARRRLLAQIAVPSLPANDVLPPSRVQVLVDAEGNVVSAVLLPPANAVELTGRPDVGDTKALQIARTLRFAPAARPTFGELTFHWRTVPLLTTNEIEQIQVR